MLIIQHYVTFKTDVVGVQYYRGMVGKGEMVMLRREPQNQYDPNAVQVSPLFLKSSMSFMTSGPKRK